MENFVYDGYVTGQNFIGRPRECANLGNCIISGNNTVIYEPPYSGKKSIIHQVILNMGIKEDGLSIFGMNLNNIRSLSSLLIKFGSAVIRNIATTPEEYETVMQKHLAGTHFVFDHQRFSTVNEAVSLNWDPDPNDVAHIFKLPSEISKERKCKTITIIEEFQTITRLKESDMVFRKFKEALQTSSANGNVFIITGSRYNEMKSIFSGSMFYNIVTRIPLAPMDDRIILDYVSKAFKPSGKEIQNDLILGATRLFRGNMWYINHFCSLCAYLTRGYINSHIMMSALNRMIFIHKGRFEYIMDNLTDYQISFLCAMIDGVDRFTSSDVIQKYKLNSSANVARVKEALMKKEIITSNEKDELIILDPLFEYWVKRYYFEKNEEEYFQF